jgi:hypothetical protein
MAGKIRPDHSEVLREQDRDSVPAFKQAPDAMDQHHDGAVTFVAKSEPATGMFCETVQFSLLYEGGD